jgi:hypothetical protein
MATMRRQWRRRAGQGALLALLLQLVLPFSTVHQATAEPGLGGAFVICTSAGLVWIDPDGRRASGAVPDGDPDTAHYCPVCSTKQLAAAAVLPVGLALGPAGAARAALAAPATTPLIASSAPPLPPRGPPFAG